MVYTALFQPQVHLHGIVASEGVFNVKNGTALFIHTYIWNKHAAESAWEAKVLRL